MQQFVKGHQRGQRSENKINAKVRLFYRLLISYNDFHQASQIASYIVSQKLQAKVERFRSEHRYRIKLLWQALNCAMVVSYCRPFSGNDRRSANQIPDLPKRFLKVLTQNERNLHDVAMHDRNTLLAHSDSEAWNLRPFFYKSASGKKMLVPLHSSVRAPFVHSAVEQIQRMCAKLMEYIFSERMQLEKELMDIIPIVPEDELHKQRAYQRSGG